MAAQVLFSTRQPTRAKVLFVLMAKKYLAPALLFGALLFSGLTDLAAADAAAPREQPKFEPIAEYAPADAAAAAKIKRVLTDAGIRSVILESGSASVHVDAARVSEAKALLQKIAAEGHPSVKTFTIREGGAALDQR